MAYTKPLAIYKKGGGSFDGDVKWTPGVHGAEVWKGDVDFQEMSIRERRDRFGDPDNIRAGKSFFQDVDNPTETPGLITTDMVAMLDNQEAAIVEISELSGYLVLKLL